MQKKTLVGLAIVAFFVVLVLYLDQYGKESVREQVRRTDNWIECQAEFREQYQKAGGNPYTLDGQKATDKWCGDKP